MTPPRTVLLSCGEASGERYASAVATALRELEPSLRLVGVGGPELEAAGVELWASRTQLEVMGFGEVVRHLPRLRRLRAALERRCRAESVQLFLPVDYPGFHISLAGRLRRQGISVLDLIPPKTWSWGSWRVGALRRSVDRCAVIFPFEQEYYRARGVDAEFVGHPLAAERPLPQGPRAGLLLVPGSRRQELAAVGRTVGLAARRLREEHALESVRVSRAPGVALEWLDELRQAAGECEVAEGPLASLLGAARAAIVTSGTASLETALAATPHVIVYRTSPLTFFLARRLATVEHIGMANIVLGRRAFPELLQSALQVEALVAELGPLLEAGPAGAQQRADCAEVRSRLVGGRWSARVAEMAVSLLDARPARI